MSVEAPRGEPRKDNTQPYFIRLDVPFRPYERVRQNYWPKKGENPALYYERYDHTLLLRRPISLYGILGHIDIISDDPWRSWIEATTKSLPVEKPFGETHFEFIYRGREDITYTEQPHILRFGFLLRTPADYAKLLDTYVDVEMGKEKYMAAWNLSIPRVARRMQRLEEGGELALTEKNLFNLKTVEGVKPPEDTEDGHKEDFGRVTFVWLLADRKKLRTIKLTFHRFFDEGDEEPQPESLLPDRERLLVRS